MGRTVVALALAGLVAACRGQSFPAPPEGRLSSPNAVGSGESLYRRDCAICHGPAGHGDGPQAKSLNPSPSDLRNLQGVRAEPGYWFLRIKEGGKEGPLPRERSAMPAWGDHLSDNQIWDLVAYLNALAGGGR